MAMNTAQQPPRFAAIVVGGGPAGIATLGNLLQEIESGPIAWVDPDFRGGRIPKAYTEVPSNTRAALFVAFAKGYTPFLDVIRDTPSPNALTAIEDLQQDKPCSLRYAGEMLQMLSDGLAKNSRVECFRGRITEAAWSEQNKTWSLSHQTSSDSSRKTLESELVVYCTGSSPTTAALPQELETSPTPMDLDLALKPSSLAQAIPSDIKTTIGVVGASHSAILVLMNLVRLAQTSHPLLTINWFTRSPTLKYAVYEDGKIFHDNTGLKGEAAEFARTLLDGDRLQAGPVRDIVRRIDCSGGAAEETKVLLRELPQCSRIVQAIGYTPNELPLMEKPFRFDRGAGGFVDGKSGKRLIGLYGAGIAFPERVIDPSGDVEYAVGFFKFMKSLKQAVPQWLSETGLDAEKSRQ